MKNRIEVDGVWYTREDHTTPEVKPQLEPSIAFEGLVFESDLYCFEATRLRDDTGNFYDKQCDIKFTDKNNDFAESEHWDSVDWMNAFLSDDSEAIDEALHSLCTQGLIELKEVLKELAEKGWI